MKVEKLTIKQIFIMSVTAFSFLVLLGALIVPILVYYKVGISEGFYNLYSRICHESASGFYFNGARVPLCAKCLGFYGGLFLTLALYLERIKIPHYLYIALGVLGVGEYVLEYFGLIFPNDWVRLTAGLFFGSFLIVTILRLNIKIKKDY